MIMPGYIFVSSANGEVTWKPIWGGVILVRLSGDEKKSQASSIGIGNACSQDNKYVFMYGVNGYSGLMFGCKLSITNDISKALTLYCKRSEAVHDQYQK